MTPADASGDPRQIEPVASDIRPVVAVPRRGLPNWLIAVGIAALALLLFSVLEARRQRASSPTTVVGGADAVRTASAAPPLYIPPTIVAVAPQVIEPVPVTPAPATPTASPPPSPPPPPQIVYVPQPSVATAPLPEASQRPTGDARSPALVYDSGTADPSAGAAGGASAASSDGATMGPAVAQIARARRLTNRATTVAQGTLIPAVLESALDSTRPGPVRALVTRNVRSADGSRVLIPRGSRLFGEYRADLAPGQNRALVMWTRLIRPDGAAVALASPAADPLGRVGVRGKVDTHFLTRFGGALLQSILDVGVNLASRRVNQQVYVNLPGSQATQAAGNALTGGGQVTPTLKVRQGVSLSVFVARDLDFTGVQR